MLYHNRLKSCVATGALLAVSVGTLAEPVIVPNWQSQFNVRLDIGEVGQTQTLFRPRFSDISATFPSMFDDFIIELKTHVKLLPPASSYYFQSQSQLYDYFSVPLIGYASTGRRLQLELFGQWYDKKTYCLTHLSSDSALAHYFPDSTDEYFDRDFAMGLGANFRLGESSSLQTLFSTGSIPGLGDSNLAISFEFQY